MKQLIKFLTFVFFISVVALCNFANAQGPAPHYSGGGGLSVAPHYSGGGVSVTPRYGRLAPHYSGAGVGVVPRNYGGRFAPRYYGGPIPHYSGNWVPGAVPHYTGDGGGRPYVNLNFYGNRVGGSAGVGGFYFHF